MLHYIYFLSKFNRHEFLYAWYNIIITLLEFDEPANNYNENDEIMNEWRQQQKWVR